MCDGGGGQMSVSMICHAAGKTAGPTVTVTFPSWGLNSDFLNVMPKLAKAQLGAQVVRMHEISLMIMSFEP